MATEWVIDVRFAGDPRLDPKMISSLFGTDWRKLHEGLTIFALDPDTGRWTFLISSDGPREVTQLKMSWELIDPISDDDEPLSPQIFSTRASAVREAVQHLGIAELNVSFSPDDAVRRAHWLREFKARLDYSPTLNLHAPIGKKFEGLDIWEVMLCLGLKWGDMDVFHWENTGGFGDDHFFSVWTSTPPGYFFPEAISPGRSVSMISSSASLLPGARNLDRFSRSWLVRSNTPRSGLAEQLPMRWKGSRASTRSDRRSDPSNTN